MGTQTYTDGVTLTAAAEFNNFDSVAYAVLSGVAGTNTITATGPANYTSSATRPPVWFIPAVTNTAATTINITPSGGVALGAKNIFFDGIALSGGELVAGQIAGVVYDGTQYNLISSCLVPSLGICEGRLTLTSGTAVTTSDVTAAGTLYFTPYKGNRVALFDGTRWKLYIFAEVSLTLTLTSGKPYDIWLFDNAGTITLEALVWTNDTTRATALALQNGVNVKTGATTRRYLGTVYSSGSNITEDSFAKRYVWNYYNRVARPMRCATETTDSWQYQTDSYRQARASAANQLDYVVGLSEDQVTARVAALVASDQSVGNVNLSVGVGVDSTSANSAQTLINPGNISAGLRQSCLAWYEGFPGVGRHTLVWLERSTAAGTTTWYGDNGQPTFNQSGVSGEVLG